MLRKKGLGLCKQQKPAPKEPKPIFLIFVRRFFVHCTQKTNPSTPKSHPRIQKPNPSIQETSPSTQKTNPSTQKTNHRKYIYIYGKSIISLPFLGPVWAFWWLGWGWCCGQCVLCVHILQQHQPHPQRPEPDSQTKPQRAPKRDPKQCFFYICWCLVYF